MTRKTAIDSSNWDGQCNVPTVFEDESLTATGLLDSEGSPLYRAPPRVEFGFRMYKEQNNKA